MSKKEKSQLILKNCFVEFIGTFWLTFADCGIVVISEVMHTTLPFYIKSICPALVVASMIYSIGHISGAHINPAVTLAFAMRRAFHWKMVPLYWISQFAGAILAAFLLWAMFGNIEKLGSSTPHHSIVTSFILECMLSLLLYMVVLGTSTKHKTVGPEAAIAVAASITVCGFIGKTLSGASMNPARSFGPALISGNLSDIWIYFLAPFLASVMAVLLTRVIQGPLKPEEKEAARGEKVH